MITAAIQNVFVIAVAMGIRRNTEHTGLRWHGKKKNSIEITTPATILSKAKAK